MLVNYVTTRVFGCVWINMLMIWNNWMDILSCFQLFLLRRIQELCRIQWLLVHFQHTGPVIHSFHCQPGSAFEPIVQWLVTTNDFVVVRLRLKFTKLTGSIFSIRFLHVTDCWIDHSPFLLPTPICSCHFATFRDCVIQTYSFISITCNFWKPWYLHFKIHDNYEIRQVAGQQYLPIWKLYRYPNIRYHTFNTLWDSGWDTIG